MAEKLASLKKKGGKMSETVLWTNSAPTSNFGNTSIALSEAYTNFKQILFRVCVTTATDKTMDYIFNTDEFVDSVVNTLAPTPTFGFYYSSSFWYRMIFSVDSTHVSTTHAIQNTTTNDAALIPIQIIGLK